MFHVVILTTQPVLNSHNPKPLAVPFSHITDFYLSKAGPRRGQLIRPYSTAFVSAYRTLPIMNLYFLNFGFPGCFIGRVSAVNFFILREYSKRRVSSWASDSFVSSPRRFDWFLKLARSSPTDLRTREVFALWMAPRQNEKSFTDT